MRVPCAVIQLNAWTVPCVEGRILGLAEKHPRCASAVDAIASEKLISKYAFGRLI